MTELIDNIKVAPSYKYKKIIVWIISFVLFGFVILSAFGWFFATYMALTGKFGPEGKELIQDLSNLSVLDHIVRISRVILIIVASSLLIVSKRIALKLFLASLYISIFTSFFVGDWGVTFLTPFVLIISCTYVYMINRWGFLQ